MKAMKIKSYSGGIDSDASMDNSVNMQKIPKVSTMPMRKGRGEAVMVNNGAMIKRGRKGMTQ